MKYRQLGATGLRVSEIALGALTFGESDSGSFMHNAGMPAADAFAVMQRALDTGINFWDTADVYGSDGLSERVIGDFFRAHGRRNEVVLATKGRFATGPGPNDRGASRLHLVQAVEASLRRLGTDHIDLYYVHMQDACTGEEEVVRALDDLVRAGKIVYLGASNYAAYRLIEHLWCADRLGANRFVCLQAQYSLVERTLEYEHLPALRRFGLGLVPWSPLARGFLTGRYRRGEAPPEGARLAQPAWRQHLEAYGASERNWRVLDELLAVARALGTSPVRVALAWALGRPQVSAVVVGMRGLSHLDDAVAAAALELPAETRARLDAVSAPPLLHPYDFLAEVDGRW